jgi:hypothetical protein
MTNQYTANSAKINTADIFFFVFYSVKGGADYS